MVYTNKTVKAVTNPISELLKKRETLSRDIERNKQQAEVKRKEAAKISDEIKKIDGDISTTEKRINQTNSVITDTQTSIVKITTDISQKENELSSEQSDQNEAIRTIYETTEQNPVYLLFGSSISDIIDRSTYLESLEAKIESTIKDITTLRDELVNDKNDLVKKQHDLEDLKKQQIAYSKGLDYQKSKKQLLLVNAKDAIAQSEQRINEAKKAYLDVNSELYKLTQAAKRKASIKTGNKKIGNLTFAWPLSGTLTTNFGEPTPIQSFHTGYDIDGVIGDSIVASADGTVSFAGGNSNYGYGLYVMIDHGDGVSTLYGHMSGFEVKSGDTVKRGDKIGYVGNTGFAIAFSGGDGSHLHFEVREDNIPVNPGIYLP